MGCRGRRSDARMSRALRTDDSKAGRDQDPPSFRAPLLGNCSLASCGDGSALGNDPDTGDRIVRRQTKRRNVEMAAPRRILARISRDRSFPGRAWARPCSRRISLVVRDLGELHVLPRVHRSTSGGEACEQRSKRLDANRHGARATPYSSENLRLRCATESRAPKMIPCRSGLAVQGPAFLSWGSVRRFIERANSKRS